MIPRELALTGRAGVQGLSPLMRKAVKLNQRMHSLGQAYRAQTPKKKRSMQRWLAFLKLKAPDLLGGKQK